MNVIVANKYEQLLGTLSLEVIKKVTGMHEVEEIISMFSHFFFQRMILDITAIKAYKEFKNLQKLSMALDTSKIILLLDDDAESQSPEYLSKLISMGFYNFTHSREGLEYLLKNPNIYKDVAHIHQINDLATQISTRIIEKNVKALGIKNLTDQAGASTLIYMLKKQLSFDYRAVGLEIDKNDFLFFNDNDMISTTSENLGKDLIRLNQNYDIILIDLNKSNNEDACNDVLYLVEPSILKLNKLIKKNKNVFKDLSDKKIVLNKSLLDEDDIREFEMESQIKVFYSIPPLNDRKLNKTLDNFLSTLGFGKLKKSSDDKHKVFGVFKF